MKTIQVFAIACLFMIILAMAVDAKNDDKRKNKASGKGSNKGVVEWKPNNQKNAGQWKPNAGQWKPNNQKNAGQWKPNAGQWKPNNQKKNGHNDGWPKPSKPQNNNGEGIIQKSGGKRGGSIKGTFWSTQSDSGGCSLPEGNYAVVDAIALGQMGALGGLRWEAGMCGQVLNIQCGDGEPVQAVVASTCNVGSDSCGVDMIKRTWDKATGNKSPGEVFCSVSLAHTNPLHENHMLCYNRPSTDPSPYYVNLGVMNTGGEILKSATLDGIEGQNSNGGWFAFNAQGGKTFGDKSVAEFKFRSGKTTKFFLSNCQKSGSVHIFQ